MMKYLFIILLLTGCMFPPEKPPPAPESTSEPVVEPEKIEPIPDPEPKKRLSTKVITIIEKPLPPCDVTQDNGQQQIIDTMDCLLEKK